MLGPCELRLLDIAVDVASRLPSDDRYLHTVAAAALDVYGNVHTGVNVFHFTGGPCAELVALGSAAGRGAAPIAAIVAVTDGERGVLAPCGRCRQVLVDQHPDCRVILTADDGTPFTVRAQDLLPYAYENPGADPPRLLRFNPRNWGPLVEGVKSATTRLGDPTRPGPVTLLFEFDAGYRSLRGVVDSVEQVRLGDITDAQAALEGCTADELRTALREHYYPGITDDVVVDFVRFHVLGA